jgi:hypothetical protein
MRMLFYLLWFLSKWQFLLQCAEQLPHKIPLYGTLVLYSIMFSFNLLGCKNISCLSNRGMYSWLSWNGAVFFFGLVFFLFKNALRVVSITFLWYIPFVVSGVCFLWTRALLASHMLGLDEWNPSMKIIRQIWF